MKTMGNLVRELRSRLYGKPPDIQTTEAITEAIVAIGLRVDADPESLNQKQQKLDDLVAERNQLIHQDLAGFDPASAQSCRDWIARLDEQNQRILSQLKSVEQLINTAKEGFRALLAFVDSDEYRRTLVKPQRHS